VKPQVATGLLLRLVYQHLSSQKISRLSQHRLKVESDCKSKFDFHGNIYEVMEELPNETI
jgi:hypothetical protein